MFNLWPAWKLLIYLGEVIDQPIGSIRWTMFSTCGQTIWDKWVSPSLGQLIKSQRTEGESSGMRPDVLVFPRRWRSSQEFLRRESGAVYGGISRFTTCSIRVVLQFVFSGVLADLIHSKAAHTLGQIVQIPPWAAPTCKSGKGIFTVCRFNLNHSTAGSKTD